MNFSSLMDHNFVLMLFIINFVLLLHKYYNDTKKNFKYKKKLSKGKQISVIEILPNVFEFIIFVIFSGIPYLQIVVFLMLLVNFFIIFQI